jgi:hypothetical protein
MTLLCLQTCLSVGAAQLRVDNCLRDAAHPMTLVSPVSQSLWGTLTVPQPATWPEASSRHAASLTGPLLVDSSSFIAPLAGRGFRDAEGGVSQLQGPSPVQQHWPDSPLPSPSIGIGNAQPGDSVPRRQQQHTPVLPSNGAISHADPYTASMQLQHLPGQVVPAPPQAPGARGSGRASQPSPALQLYCQLWQDTPGGVRCLQTVHTNLAPLAINLEEVQLRALAAYAASVMDLHKQAKEQGGRRSAWQNLSSAGRAGSLPGTPTAASTAAAFGTENAAALPWPTPALVQPQLLEASRGVETLMAVDIGGAHLRALHAAAAAAAVAAHSQGTVAHSAVPAASTRPGAGASAVDGNPASAVPAAALEPSLRTQPGQVPHEPDIRVLAAELPSSVLSRPKVRKKGVMHAGS